MTGEDFLEDRGVGISGEELPVFLAALRSIDSCWLTYLFWIKGIPDTIPQEVEGKQCHRDGNGRE